jgi:DNA-binding LacI/PurR family transcriptional regulator
MTATDGAPEGAGGEGSAREAARRSPTRGATRARDLKATGETARHTTVSSRTVSRVSNDDSRGQADGAAADTVRARNGVRHAQEVAGVAGTLRLPSSDDTASQDAAPTEAGPPPAGTVSRSVGRSLSPSPSPVGDTARKAPRPSMGDVARHAGVSSQTVSRVSNGHSNVDAATRQRVIDSMRALGYRPNSAARALRSGRFHTIGVIMFTLRTFGNMRTLDAIATEAARANYSVMLIPVTDATLEQVSGAYSRLSEQGVDGVIIVFEAHLLDNAEFTLPPGLPVVVIDSNAGPEYTVVDTDQAEGARQATEHLLGLGHRQVWHIAGPETSFSAVHRVESWRRTLEDAGIEPPPVLYGDWSTESGHRHGLTLGRRPDVTAIFAANDQMALGAVRALHELGRDVPGDISVVGFDDLEEAHSFWPPLTTIRQDFGTVGRQAIQALLHKVDRDDGNRRVTVATRLVVRASTAPPK